MDSELLPPEERLRQTVKGIWRPPPRIPSWQWAEENVTTIPYSPVAGGFDSDLVPAVRPIMDAITGLDASLVVLAMSVQSCKSLAIELSIAWSIVNDPGPTMLILPQTPEANDQMTMRLRPLLDNIPEVEKLIPKGADRDLAKKTSILLRNGMSLWCLGSHPRNLQRRSLRKVLIDEAWQWENGRIAEAMARTTAFGYLGKTVVASQGSDSDHDFAKLWKTTNQQTWCFSCPECSRLQPFSWNQIEFDPIKTSSDEYDFPAIAETVHYLCEHCKTRFENEDETRRDLNKTGKFQVGNSNASEKKVGFHLNAISTMDWSILVEEYLRAKQAAWQGEIEPIKLFTMKRLAGFHAEADDDDFQIELEGAGYNGSNYFDWRDNLDEWREACIGVMAGDIRIIPGPLEDAGARFRRFAMMAVDVQRDHFWFTLRTYQADGTSRLVRAGKLFAWDEIELLREKFEIIPALVFVDCGDTPYAESGVYSQAQRYGWTCLRGDKATTFPHRDRRRPKGVIYRYYSKDRSPVLGKGVKARFRTHHFSALYCRDILQALKGRPDYWQLPDDLADICPQYEEQAASQRRTKNQKTGKWTWKTINRQAGEHLMDCETMLVVGGLMVKIYGSEVEAEESDDPAEPATA